MKKLTLASAQSAATIKIPYIVCRNISSPEDERAGRKTYSGHVPASSVLDLDDDENVRDYLVNAQGKQRRAPTLVHQAIRKTLENNIEDFSTLNGGMVIVARGVEIDDKNRVMSVKRPSIINGSQTQGELKRYFEKYKGSPDLVDPSVKFELIVTADDDLIAEVSISRNFQNDVASISIAGRRGQLEELEKAVQTHFPGVKLRKSESDLVAEDQFLDTEKLIQVIFSLMPIDMLPYFGKEAEASGKVFTYSQKATCLKLFQKLFDENEQDVSEAKEIYAYFLKIAGPAWELYKSWKSHQGFQGTRLWSIERQGRDIIDVPDGIVFPVLGALSAFVKKTRRQEWSIVMPEAFQDKDLIEEAVQVYKEIADHNPQTMGKSKACYSALYRITRIYLRLS